MRGPPFHQDQQREQPRAPAPRDARVDGAAEVLVRERDEDLRQIVVLAERAQRGRPPARRAEPVVVVRDDGGRWEEGVDIFPDNGSCSNFWTDVYFEQ